VRAYIEISKYCSELRDGTWAEGEDGRSEGREMKGEKVEGG